MVPADDDDDDGVPLLLLVLLLRLQLGLALPLYSMETPPSITRVRAEASLGKEGLVVEHAHGAVETYNYWGSTYSYTARGATQSRMDGWMCPP